MALWNLPGRSGQRSHPRFSDLIRNQLYRSTSTNQDDFVHIDASIDYESDPRPTSAAVIESLIDIRISSETDQQKPCAVCRDCIRLNDIIKQLPCHHQYHTDCIVPWLSRRNTCPICRYGLPTDDDDYDISRQAIRRIEFSPERNSSLSILEEQSDSHSEISDLDDESVDSGNERLLNELGVRQGEEGEESASERNAPNIYETQFNFETNSSHHQRSTNQENEFYEDRAQSNGSLNLDTDMISSAPDPGLEQDQLNSFDMVSIEVQDRINTQLAILHSQISHLEQRLEQATSALDFERNRHHQLRTHLNDLESSFLKSDSLERYKELYDKLYQGFRQFRQILEEQFDQ